jgi:ubiquinone/menaquinone biosynthesis C-methylase UbiE
MVDFKYLKHLGEIGVTNIHPGGEKATDLLIESLELKDSMHVLEVGCGTGETLVKIASSYNVHLEGLDILDEMIRICKRRINFSGLSGRIHVEKLEEGSEFPFPNDCFDRVYTESALCFHELARVKQMLGEIHRVLKKGSIYAANEAIWIKGISPELIKQITEDAERDFGLRPSSNEALFLHDWMEIFKNNGFEIISTDKVDSRSPKVKASRLTTKIIRSKIFTLLCKSKLIFSFRLLKEYFFFKRILKSHHQETPVLEARIFFLRKK